MPSSPQESNGQPGNPSDEPPDERRTFSGWQALLALAIIGGVAVAIVIVTGSVDGVEGIVKLLVGALALIVGAGAIIKSWRGRD